MPEFSFCFITIIEGHWKTLNAENDTASNTVINLSHYLHPVFQKKLPLGTGDNAASNTFAEFAINF